MEREFDFHHTEQLHALVARLLTQKYREVELVRTSDGRVAISFSHREFGKARRFTGLVVDAGAPLERTALSTLRETAMSGSEFKASQLLIVTRHGISEDAARWLNAIDDLHHQTIWDIEELALSLGRYVEGLVPLYYENGLADYYVHARARPISYSGDKPDRFRGEPIDLFDAVLEWLAGDSNTPIAVLGNYGSGKSSFAKRLVTHLAECWRGDPSRRRPILIPLGVFAGQTRLEGILGAMFTADSKVDDFDFDRLMEHSERGRLVFILDGFDEMKHAMTFTDFRGQLGELSRLFSDNSRVILLGRPSALLSDVEHAHVLRGRERYEGGWRKLANWPEFREFDIAGFTPPERAAFLHGYLRYRADLPGSDMTLAQADERAEAVDAIAEQDPAIFSKPVHAQILGDLAARPGLSLDELKRIRSKWSLYSLFFEKLGPREASKAARSPIAESARVEFLRQVAYWLWTEVSGATSFLVGDLPDRILAALPEGGAVDPEGKKREYLSGSFLEAKAGDQIFYFPHRSFAEFLVAQWTTLNPPSERDHSRVSRLVADGVAEFLLEPEVKPSLREWARTFERARGTVHLAYVDTLRNAFDAADEFNAAIGPRGWVRFTRLFRGPIKTGAVTPKELLGAIGDPDDGAAALALIHYMHIQLADPGGSRTSVSKEVTVDLIRALLVKLFEHERHQIDNREFRIPKRLRSWRDMVAPSIKREPIPLMQSDLNFDWSELYVSVEAHLREKCLIPAADSETLFPSKPQRVPFATVLEAVPRQYQERIETYFARNYTLRDLVLGRD